jgi:FlaA1/EpsC-like NDP-sugar epimerase
MRGRRFRRDDGGSSSATGGRPLRAVATRFGPHTLAALDALRSALGFLAVLILRFDGSVPEAQWARFGRFLIIAIVVQLAANWRFRLYDQVWRYASVDEAMRVVGSGAVTLVLLLVFDAVSTPRVPVSVVVFGVVLNTAIMGASRFQTRLLASLNRNRRGRASTPVAIVGADESVALLIRSLRADQRPGSPRAVVVLSDDYNDRNRGRALLGVPIAGSIEDLPPLTKRLGIVYVLAATPSREVLRRAAAAAEDAGIALKMVPDVSHVLENGRVARAMRDVQIEDLLGREQVRTDLEAVRRQVAGRRVLITGAGGSIGSEIARQVASFDPDTLVLLDHDETHLFDVAASMERSAIQVLADIRDQRRMLDVFADHRPEVVFHAAAHKHVPLLEAFPCEAVRTNVDGARNVLSAAASVDTRHLVFISTDKAVDPSSVMGASKWLGEQLVRLHAPAGSLWCAVRFGNVLGSRGSVIPTFTRQIEAGGPVTVTDPSMTRYFMSTHEAVQLVLQASALAHGTDVFMLEMGEPVNILDLARKMIRLSGYAPGSDIPIVISGTRPGEKLEEQLSWTSEQTQSTAHSSIQQLLSSDVDPVVIEEIVSKLDDLVDDGDDEAVSSLLLQAPRQAMISPHRDDDHEAGTWSPATI